MGDASLKPFFTPQGVAIIGASSDANKLGYALARNLLQSDFRQPVYFINSKGEKLFDRLIYPDISMVPDPVDLAIILIPAPAIPKVLTACGQRGIRAAIICSGGFRETGADGARLEEQCLAIAQEYSIRLIGPNCIGVLDTHLPINTTFLTPPGPQPGDIALISHSGSLRDRD